MSRRERIADQLGIDVDDVPTLAEAEADLRDDERQREQEDR